MEAYEVPVLNQIAFGVGFGAVMFWPAWLAALVMGVVGIKRGQKLSGWSLIVAAVVPALITAVFFALLQMNVDVGSKNGVAATALEFSAWVMVVLSFLCALGIVLTLIRWLAAWLLADRGARHA